MDGESSVRSKRNFTHSELRDVNVYNTLFMIYLTMLPKSICSKINDVANNCVTTYMPYIATADGSTGLNELRGKQIQY